MGSVPEVFYGHGAGRLVKMHAVQELGFYGMRASCFKDLLISFFAGPFSGLFVLSQKPANKPMSDHFYANHQQVSRLNLLSFCKLPYYLPWVKKSEVWLRPMP